MDLDLIWTKEILQRYSVHCWWRPSVYSRKRLMLLSVVLIVFFQSITVQGTTHSLVRCELCPVGHYQDEEGQSTCKPCPAGEYNPDTLGADACLECGLDTYSFPGATECVPRECTHILQLLYFCFFLSLLSFCLLSFFLSLFFFLWFLQHAMSRWTTLGRTDPAMMLKEREWRVINGWVLELAILPSVHSLTTKLSSVVIFSSFTFPFDWAFFLSPPLLPLLQITLAVDQEHMLTMRADARTAQ